MQIPKQKKKQMKRKLMRTTLGRTERMLPEYSKPCCSERSYISKKKDPTQDQKERDRRQALRAAPSISEAQRRE